MRHVDLANCKDYGVDGLHKARGTIIMMLVSYSTAFIKSLCMVNTVLYALMRRKTLFL